MMRPETGLPAFDCSRQYTHAKRLGAKVPLRCTLMTASHSASDIENNMRSRKIPALLTTMLRSPKVSIAVLISRSAPAQSLTLSPLATASPPIPLISCTTCSAGLKSPPLPSMFPPRSLTTTLAPCDAKLSACSRPIPRPAPVTMAIFPSHNRAMSGLLMICVPPTTGVTSTQPIIENRTE